LVTYKECQIPEHSRRYLNGILYPKDHKEDPSTDNVKQDICQMKVKNWITCVQDRGKWKDVVEKAITFKH